MIFFKFITADGYSLPSSIVYCLCFNINKEKKHKTKHLHERKINEGVNYLFLSQYCSENIKHWVQQGQQVFFP
jgi:hypothetical protein